MIRRAIALCFAAALLGAPAAQAAEFGFSELDFSFAADREGTPATQAGSHPFAVTAGVAANTEVVEGLGKIPAGQPRDLRVTLPPGFVGSPDATPQCDAAHFSVGISYFGGAATLPDCSESAVVGLARARGAGDRSGNRTRLPRLQPRAAAGRGGPLRHQADLRRRGDDRRDARSSPPPTG